MVKTFGTLQSAPLALRRETGDSWKLVNRTSRVITGLSANVLGPNNEHREVSIRGGLLQTDEPEWVGELKEGDTLILYWVTLGRKRAKGRHSGTVRVRGDADEYLVKSEDQPRGNGGR